MSETKGEQFKRLWREMVKADLALDDATASDVSEAAKRLIDSGCEFRRLSESQEFADYVLGLESQLTAALAKITDLEASLRQSVEHGAAGWAKAGEAVERAELAVRELNELRKVTT